MIQVIIVDDDTINRTAIATMIDWEQLDCCVAYEAENGKEALEFMKIHPIDLVITDIKMPVMDGLEFIRQLHELNYPCLIGVISSYNEFDLVREAFKIGIEDYFLKSELNETNFEQFIKKMKERINQTGFNREGTTDPKKLLREKIMGNAQDNGQEYQDYYVIALQLDDIEETRKRFPNLKDDLLAPIYELLNQIAKVKKDGIITNYSEKKIIIVLCHIDSYSLVQSICQRMITMLSNFLNIDCSIGVSSFGETEHHFSDFVKEAISYSSLHYVYGMKKVFGKAEAEQFGILSFNQKIRNYQPISDCLRQFDIDKLIQLENQLIGAYLKKEKNQLMKEVLHIIYYESIWLEDHGDYIWNAFVEKCSYPEKLERLQTGSDLIMWLSNFNRWIMDYIRERYEESEPKNFLKEVEEYTKSNYMEQTLGLANVAAYVGLNEQYFCTKFRKEKGISYIDYLAQVRIEKAKQLIKDTNLKVYEICKLVGYHSVEHFGRVFHKKTGMSPKSYKESQTNIIDIKKYQEN